MIADRIGLHSALLPLLINEVRDHFFRPVLRNRQVCLLVDSEEPLRERFVRVARQRGLSARTRKLPVGDFLWVLLPIGVNPDTVRDMPDQELVCETILLQIKS